MEQRILEKTPYLLGCEELLKQHGISEVYTYDKFVGEKTDGITFYVHGIDFKIANQLSLYVDNYVEDDTDILPRAAFWILSYKKRSP